MWHCSVKRCSLNPFIFIIKQYIENVRINHHLDHQNIFRFLLVFFKFFKYCAPWSPIWFKERLSVVSICIKTEKWKWKKWRDWFIRTVLYCNAWPMDCAPWSPIWFFQRSIVVSVCRKSEKKMKMKEMKKLIYSDSIDL